MASRRLPYALLVRQEKTAFHDHSSDKKVKEKDIRSSSRRVAALPIKQAK